jgi:hypothetical protein
LLDIFLQQTNISAFFLTFASAQKHDARWLRNDCKTMS